MSKRKNSPNDKSLFDMGTYVSKRIKELKLKRAEAAKQTGWSKASITALLKKRNWNALELLEMAKFIGENLFSLYLPAKEEPMLPASQVKEGLEREAKLEEKLRKAVDDLKIMTTKYETALEVIEAMKK